MKFILSTLLITTLSLLAGLYFPWWSLALVAFAVTLLIPQGIGAGFLSGFLGVFIAWAIVATWKDIGNDSILSKRVAEAFSLDGSSLLLILISALIGALVGGFAAMAGSSLRVPARRRV